MSELVKEIEKEIAEGETHRLQSNLELLNKCLSALRWRDVTEELPKKEGFYLVRTEYEHNPIKRSWFDPKTKHWTSSLGVAVQYFTATEWLPIPE